MKPQTLGFKKPEEVDYLSEDPENFRIVKYEYGFTEILVVCVKYGKKYGSDYVNKLYKGVKQNLNLPHKFICFTDDSKGLDNEIKTISLKN